MAITFQHVRYIYSAKTPFQYDALNGIDLTIRDRSFTAIVGHTGSGKTTLVQHINGLLLPSEGSVTVNGFTIEAKKPVKRIKDLRQQVGLVFQFPEYQLFEDTVENDVAFGPTNFGVSKTKALEAAHEALTLVGLDQSYYNRSPFELSGGERRRVAIAGIIAMKPKILVLDEPTAGLDPRGARRMMELFQSLHRQGTTIILVTHDMNWVVEYASEVIVMQDGQVAIHTTPEKLFEGDYKKYGLEVPMVYAFHDILKQKGIAIPLNKVHKIEDLSQALASALREKKTAKR